ncbi:MAG TPA: hypothetical protein VF131_18795 [Blastocatellia bacterium]|nr:hypothetical protein [Blastocatellia bacterium]
MKMKMGDVLNYKDSQVSILYGNGVVTSITSDEYTILWSGRGLTRYKRSILDGKVEQIFQQVDKSVSHPKERRLNLGAPKNRVAFNENFDRARVEMLCGRLRLSGAGKAKDLAEGLTTELFTKKVALREATKAVLLQLAELCGARKSAACEEACSISRELFFGYVLQKSDFDKL